MVGRDPGRALRRSRRQVPQVEGLDRRELMAVGGIAQSLGPYVGPAKSGPRVIRPAVVVNAHDSVQQLLASILGPGLDRVQARGEAAGQSPAAVLRKQVLGQPFVHSVLANGDTYLLFRTPAFNGLIGSQQISGMTATSPTATDQAGTASPTPTTPGTTTPAATPNATTSATAQSVAFSIPDQATIQSMNGPTSIVLVAASGGVPGFYAEVPTASIRVLESGPTIRGSVLIPTTSIPAGFPTPDTTFLSNGTFSATYAATGPLLEEILDSGAAGVAPNAPKSVPGLRLAPFLKRNKVFPNAAARKDLFQGFRLAVQRNVFTLNDAQQTRVSDGLDQFTQRVQGMVAGGEFAPAIPLAPPPLPTKALAGTLSVSAGVVRQLVRVDPGVAGLPLAGLGNFPGRLDVGYVVDRAGNYGILLTIRGALKNANPGLRPGNIAGGDVRVEVSNATNIEALGGRRLIEGVQNGAFVSTDLESSRTESGIVTFSASAGNGFGVEYGTGVGYSTVIPLGNVYSLIPSAPLR
ncbi:hypothetical protein TA3x_000283 [Tundrisphaera sp. TA3]|uniref:hypothetical protein n=1 Tax=Tundrisphaera sp. TA3 TaxID=3435775 RepID=UPI003EC0AAF5